MKILLMACAAWLGWAQDPKPEPPAPPKFKIDLKLVIDPAGGEWRFKVEGTTDLPDDTKLDGRIVVSELVDDFRGGKRVDDEYLPDQMHFKVITVKDGKFGDTIHAVTKKPYSLRYSAKLTYVPDKQEDAIATKVGSPEVSVLATIGKFDDPQLEKELGATSKELTLEMDQILAIHRGLKKKITEWIKAHDEKAYAAWKKELVTQLDDIRFKNDQRFSLWAVWLERQAKYRIEAFVDRFNDTCKVFERWLEKKDEEILEGLNRSLNGFMTSFEEAREVMGLEAPVDPESVALFVKDYETAVIGLAALDAASWKDKAPALRDQARTALLKMVAQKLIPRRIYGRIVSLTQEFLAIYSLQAEGSDAKGLEAARAAHAQTLAEFKQYAGIK